MNPRIGKRKRYPEAETASLPATDASRQLALEIRAAWQKSVEGILETGRLLIQAKDQVNHGEWRPWVEKHLPFSERTAQMLMEIARNPVITNTKYISVLPRSWAALHALAALPESKLIKALEKGDISSDLSVAKAQSMSRYQYEDVVGAVETLLYFAEEMPDTDSMSKLSEVLVDSQTGNLSAENVAKLTELSAWLLVLQKACLGKSVSCREFYEHRESTTRPTKRDEKGFRIARNDAR